MMKALKWYILIEKSSPPNHGKENVILVLNNTTEAIKAASVESSDIIARITFDFFGIRRSG